MIPITTSIVVIPEVPSSEESEWVMSMSDVVDCVAEMGVGEAEPDSKCTFAAPLMSELSSFATNRMFVSLHLSNQPQSNDRMALVMADLEQT
jgi:hypothetical protein